MSANPMPDNTDSIIAHKPFTVALGEFEDAHARAASIVHATAQEGDTPANQAAQDAVTMAYYALAATIDAYCASRVTAAIVASSDTPGRADTRSPVTTSLPHRLHEELFRLIDQGLHSSYHVLILTPDESRGVVVYMPIPSEEGDEISIRVRPAASAA